MEMYGKAIRYRTTGNGNSYGNRNRKGVKLPFQLEIGLFKDNMFCVCFFLITKSV